VSGGGVGAQARGAAATWHEEGWRRRGARGPSGMTREGRRRMARVEFYRFGDRLNMSCIEKQRSSAKGMFVRPFA
jgi:hypothetical protein